MHKRTILLNHVPGYKHTIGYKPYHSISAESNQIVVVEPYTVVIETDTPLDQPPTVDDVLRAVEIAATKAADMIDRLVTVKADLAATGQLTEEIMVAHRAAMVSLS